MERAPADGAGFSPWRAHRYHPGRKLLTVFRGLRHGVLSDASVGYKVVLSFLLIGLSVWLRQWLDVAVIALVTAGALTAELFNTAIEELCDFVRPGHDPRIGAIQDVAAAAGGIAILVWVAVVSHEYYKAARMLLEARQTTA